MRVGGPSAIYHKFGAKYEPSEVRGWQVETHIVPAYHGKDSTRSSLSRYFLSNEQRLGESSYFRVSGFAPRMTFWCVGITSRNSNFGAISVVESTHICERIVALAEVLAQPYTL
jgi:hypothetical protein